jgi:hypothetical protein
MTPPQKPKINPITIVFVAILVVVVVIPIVGGGIYSVIQSALKGKPSSSSIDSGTTTSTQSSEKLPPHTVTSTNNNPSQNGDRVQVNTTNPQLSHEDCVKLANRYRPNRGTFYVGQVSVHKPDRRGELRPFCVDNLDGNGVIFNDDLFK